MLGWAALVVLAVSAAALFAEVWGDGNARPSSIFRSSPPPVEPEPEITSEPRTVFRHSVIPGGVRTAGELQAAIDSDSVVAAHHSGVTPSRVVPIKLSSDRRVYMSYRVGDKVYWTKNKVLLRKGEDVLADGEKHIRARCGNGMSLDPMLPTAEAEPAPAEFEEFFPLIASRTFVNNAIRALSGETPDYLSIPDPSMGLFVPTQGGPGGTPGFFWDPTSQSDPPSDVAELAPDPADPGTFVPGILDPGGNLPPSVPGDPAKPGDPSDPGDPSGPPPLTEFPPPGVPELPPGLPPGLPPTFDPNDPGDDPVAAPEPGTLLLLGGGIGAYLARRRIARGR